MLESKFQSALIRDIKKRFPGCYVFKNDPTLNQGIPDLLVLYHDKWAALECKQSAAAAHRPNQDWHVDNMNKMSFAAFVWPENKKEVIDAMARSLKRQA